MFTVPGGISGRPIARSLSHNRRQDTANRADAKREENLRIARDHTDLYAALLRARPTPMREITQKALLSNRPGTKVRVKEIYLSYDGGRHQKNVYLDSRGNYWEMMRNRKDIYVRRHLRDFEPWELYALVRELPKKIHDLSRS